METEPRTASPTPVLAIVAALVLVQLMFATHYVAAKEVVSVMPPRIWATLRVAGAAAVLLAITRARGYSLPRGRDTLIRFAGFALLGVVINQVCFVEGIARTTPVNSALINCAIPVLTYLLAVLLGYERASAGRTAGIAVALAGIGVLLRLEAFDPGNTLVRGNLLTIVNATSFSAFLVLSRPALQRIPTLPAATLLFLLGTLPIAALAAPEVGGFHPAEVTPAIWWLAAYIILVPTVGAYLLNYWALRRAPSSMVALFIYLQPILAALLSYGVHREVPSFRDFVAFFLVAAGIALVAGDSRRRERPEA